MAWTSARCRLAPKSRLVTSIHAITTMSDDSDGWIVSTGADQKLDQATRTRVRRHVMKGQNTRASRRAKAAEQDENVAHEWIITTPRKVASEISLFGFENELPSYQAELIHKGQPWVSFVMDQHTAKTSKLSRW